MKIDKVSRRMPDFEWMVSAAGYNWVLTESERSPYQRHSYICESQGIGCDSPSRVADNNRCRVYHPLVKHSALFRKFAATPANQEGIRSFAGKYGLLGLREQARIPGEDGSWEPGRIGEPFEAWGLEILSMHLAVDMWDEINVGSMSRFIDNMSHYSSQPIGDQIRRILGKVPRNVQEAEHSLLNIVNGKLQAHTTPRLVASGEDNRVSLSIVPLNLLGAMWYQLSLAISATREQRVCAYCGVTFELQERKGARSDREYCSDVCRTRAFRKRIAEAKRLFAGGAAVEEIAAKLDTSLWNAGKWALGKTSDVALRSFLHELVARIPAAAERNVDEAFLLQYCLGSAERDEPELRQWMTLLREFVLGLKSDSDHGNGAA